MLELPPLSFVLGANKTSQRVRAYVKSRHDVNPIVDARVSWVWNHGPVYFTTSLSRELTMSTRAKRSRTSWRSSGWKTRFRSPTIVILEPYKVAENGLRVCRPKWPVHHPVVRSKLCFWTQPLQAITSLKAFKMEETYKETIWKSKMCNMGVVQFPQNLKSQRHSNCVEWSILSYHESFYAFVWGIQANLGVLSLSIVEEPNRCAPPIRKFMIRKKCKH